MAIERSDARSKIKITAVSSSKEVSNMAAENKISSPANDSYRILFYVLVAILLFLIALTFRDYGITWDEAAHNNYGKAIIKFYASGFKDTSFMESLYYYGGFFNTVGAIINKLLPFDEYQTLHLLGALFGLFGIAGCWKLAGILAGDRAAFWAAVFLAITPSYYGGMFNNPKDIPFAALFIWSLYYIVKSMSQFPTVSRAVSVKAGIMLGLLTATRVGGIFLWMIFALTLFGGMVRYLKAKGNSNSFGITVWRAISMLFITLLVAWASMAIFWPYAMQHPLLGPFNALMTHSHFDWGGKVLYGGQAISAKSLPMDYIFRHLLIQLPEFVVVLTLLSIFPIVMVCCRTRLTDNRYWNLYIVILSILIPIGFAILGHAVLYDGVRHVMFVVPVIACISGLTFDYMLGRTPSTEAGKTAVSGISIVLLGMYFVYHISVLVRLHPYEYIYYNQLIGGLQGAYKHYETDYWGLSFSEATTGLLEYLKQELKGEYASVYYQVKQCGPELAVQRHLPRNIALTTDPAKADFFISYTRDQCNETLEGKTIVTVERLGIPLNFVKDRRYLRPATDARMISTWHSDKWVENDFKLEVRLDPARPLLQIRGDMPFDNPDPEIIVRSGDRIVARESCSGPGAFVKSISLKSLMSESKDQLAVISLSANRSFNYKKMGKSEDTRNLAFRLYEIRLTPAP